MASATRLLTIGRQRIVGRVQNYLATTSRVCPSCCHSLTRQFSRSASAAGVFEPDDLKLEPDIPEYDCLNIQMRGYDFVVLESYAKHVHREADRLGLEANAWAVPARSFEIRTFKPNSSVVDNKYYLKTFERTVQIENVPSPVLAVLLNKIMIHLAEGIDITVKEPDAEEEDFRYIPDKEMEELKSQMKAIEDAREERRKK